MKMPFPLVSIAVATYNGAAFLEEQLDSIYLQSYPYIEVIVSDDCSTDKTSLILERYAQKYGLKYYTNDSRQGFIKNFEKAITLCNGEFIALSDQDDIWENNKIEILMNEIKNNLLIHSDCSIINQNGTIIYPFWKKDIGHFIKTENLIFQNVVTGCTILFRKELLACALPFPEQIAYHDWWLAFCASTKERIGFTDQLLTRYRQHTYQHTGAAYEPKNTFLKYVYSNIVKRLRNNDTDRINNYRKQLQNLQAISTYKIPLSSIIVDAILYFEDYINNKVHLKTFIIGLKYNKYLYPRKNYFYIKNFLMDIIG